MMRTTLEIVVALATGLLATGALIGGGILAAGAVSAGGCWWLWRWLRGRR
ncbi:hypothetical protein [Novosphingobium cyanobacteriorum]|uniref:Secreted protein n=1 Tax=Novosphingobium cyanobacteriorum TaxID=3024215 RepID=A0ABT6CKT2_9SPHN|nr:hypothetical protein [Novosphingobium cyanobacteriorum]MDF8334396.1 hypothetical protein [Novosphingobium cyanobacteriorum]